MISAKTIATLFAALLMLSACRSEKFDLRFNPGQQPDKTLNLNLSGNVQVALPIINVNEDFNTDIKTTMQFDSSDEGSMLTFQYEGFDKAMDSASQNISINKENNKAGALLALSKGKFQTVLDPSGKCGPVFGLDSFMSTLNSLIAEEASDAKAEALRLDTFFSGNTVTSIIDLAQHVLPGKPVAIGDTWENEAEMSPGLPFKISRKFTLETISGDTAHISMTASLRPARSQASISAAGLAWFLPPMEESKKKGFSTDNLWGTLLKHLEMDLKGTMNGTIAVNKTTGMLLHSNLDQQLDGSFKMGSTTVPLKLTVHYKYNMQ